MRVDLQRLYKQGEEQLKQREWEEAIEIFLEIARLDAGYKDSIEKLREAQVQKHLQDLFVQGKIHYDNKNWRVAIEMFQQVLSQDPYYPQVRTLLSQAQEQQRLQLIFREGEAHLEREEWKEARGKFKEIERKDPSYPGLVERLQESYRQLELQELYNQGRDSLARRDWERAVRIFGELQAKAPDYRDSSDRLREANAHWEEQRQLDELYITARNYEELKDWQKARDTYVEILRFRPDHRDVVRRLTYVVRQERKAAGISVRRPLIWERLLPQGIELQMRILGLVIAAVGLILGCNIFTPQLEQVGDLLFGRPVPTLVSPFDGTSWAKGQPITLEWELEGEWNVVFEIRIRSKASKELRKLARVRELYYIIPLTALQDSGEYEWQIVAIDERKEYPSAIWSFEWE